MRALANDRDVMLDRDVGMLFLLSPESHQAHALNRGALSAAAGHQIVYTK
jgi:hypothetical protein